MENAVNEALPAKATHKAQSPQFQLVSRLKHTRNGRNGDPPYKRKLMILTL